MLHKNKEHVKEEKTLTSPCKTLKMRENYCSVAYCNTGPEGRGFF